MSWEIMLSFQKLSVMKDDLVEVLETRNCNHCREVCISKKSFFRIIFRFSEDSKMEGKYLTIAAREQKPNQPFVDPITLDEVDITEHRRKYVFLIEVGRLQLFDVRPVNPLTRAPLSPEEIAYIKTKNLPITKEYREQMVQ